MDSTSAWFSSKRLSHLLNRTSPLNGTRVFFILLIIGCFLGTFSPTKDSLSADVTSVLIEAKILKLLSSIFVCTSVLWTLIHITVLVTLGLWMEDIRGTYQLLSFIMQVSLFSQIITLSIFLSMYYFTFDTFYLEQKVCGFTSMIGAFTIAIQEIIPSSFIIPSLKFQALTIQYLPFHLLLFVIAINLMGILSVTQMCLILCGMYIAWIYLRYFARNVNNSRERGNSNEEFAFEFMFPSVLRFPISILSNIWYSLFKNVGCCEKNGGSDGGESLGGNAMVGINMDIGGESKDGGLSSESEGDGVSVRKKKSEEENEKRMQTKRMIEQRILQLQKDCDQRTINNQS